LRQVLGDDFDDFLLQHLSDASPAARETAACILAYSRVPAAEEALLQAYRGEECDEVKHSLLFYLGWTATEASREFLLSILDGRVDGPRWSAIRTLSRSSAPDRYEIIARYLDDPDEDVRDQAAWSMKNRLEKQEKKAEQSPACNALKAAPAE